MKNALGWFGWMNWKGGNGTHHFCLWYARSGFHSHKNDESEFSS